MTVSTGPIVPFRSREMLKADNSDAQGTPLLWLHNVKNMRINWPLDSRKQQYIKVSQEAKHLLIPNRNYVLVRRFSAKEEERRIIAAPLIANNLESEFVGIENHINYIYRKGGKLSDIETLGLAAILNCNLLDLYFRIFNGNTQVSATELRNMPLPERDVIEELGSFIKYGLSGHHEIEETITNLIKQYA